MPPLMPDEDEETPGEEGGEEKEAPAEGDDAAKEEPKPEDKEEQDRPPSEQDDSEKSEGDEEPSDTSEADVRARLLDLLEERDDDLKGKIADGIKASNEAAKAEVEAEATAAEVNDLFKRAEDTNEDELDREEALKELGRRTVQVRVQAKIEAPIVEKAKKEAAQEFDGQYREGMDIVLDELGLSEAANSLTDDEKAALQPSKFANRGDWTRAVARTVNNKANGGEAGSDKAKAERRKGTAERARAGADTPRVPRGLSGEEAEKEGQTAREYILSGQDK